MTKSLTVIGLSKLLDAVEADLRETEPYSDNLDRFRALLWLESPDRTYVNDARGLCLIDTSTAFAFFIQQLLQKLNSFVSSKDKSVVAAKLILVICELIRLVPAEATDPDITNSVEKLSQMRLDSVSLGPAAKCIGYALKSTVRLAIMAGSNPMRSLLAGHINTPVDKLNKIHGLVCSSGTLECLMEALPDMVSEVTPDQKGRFFELLLEILDQFAVDMAESYAQLVRNGAAQAQPAIDAILKMKGGLDIEGAAVVCYFMPMCHTGLEAISGGKKAKTNPFGNALSVVNDAKKGKKGNGAVVASCFLNLYAAKIIGGTEKETLFSPISQFLTKAMAKWEKKLVKPKSEIIPVIYGRFAALKQAAGEADNAPLNMIIERTKDHDNAAWLALGEFLVRLGNSWPVPGMLKSVSAVVIQKVVERLVELLNQVKLAERNAENSNLTNIVSTFLEFFGKLSREELIFSLESLQGSTDPCPCSENFWILLNACPMLATTGQLAKTILSCFTSKAFLDSEVQSLVNFLRVYWRVETDSFGEVKCDQIIPHVLKFTENFMAQADFCVKQNSPNLCLLPSLFYRFLRWAHCGLTKTYQSGSAQLPRNFVLFASKTCFVLRAFTGDAILNHVESQITAIAELFGEVNPYIFPMHNISSDDSSMKEWTQNAVGVWLAFIKARFALDNVSMSVKQLISTQPQYDPTRERIGVVTGFLVQVIHYLSDRGIPDSEVKSLPRYFFGTVYNYLLTSTAVDSVFPTSFANLPECSYKLFLDIVKEKSAAKAQNCHWEGPYPYVIFIDIVTQIAAKGKLDAATVSVIEDLIPMFFSIVQFGVFPQQTVLFVKSLSELVAAFYETKIAKNQLVQASTIQTLMELVVSYGCDTKDMSNNELLLVIMKSLRSIFRDYVADISLSRPHIVKASAETRTLNQFGFILGALDALLSANQSEELWVITQEILNSILKNNHVLAWRLYILAAKRARPVFRSLLIDSLTLLCGMGYDPVWQLTLVQEEAPVSPRSMSSHDSIGVDGFLRQARGKIRREQPFCFKKEDELFDWITNNNFELFKNPPTSNPYFMESAIGCAIVFNQHDKLFEEMAKLVSNETIQTSNPVTSFFGAWFRRMMTKIALATLLEKCDPENVNAFFHEFKPRPRFTYYLGKLVQLTNQELGEAIFERHFLRACLERPWISSATKLLTPQETDTFISRLTSSHEYKQMMQSMINAEMVYPRLEFKTFAMDRQVVRSFIGENPMTFDRSLGELFDESLNARQLVSLNQSNWVMDVGKMASGARGILINVSNVPNIPVETAAAQFYLHFKEVTEKLEFFVDVTKPKPQSYGVFKEIIKQAPDNFMDRVVHITVTNLSPTVVQLLNKDFPSVPAEIKAKIRFSSDLEKLLEREDQVSLPIAALRGIDERRGIIPVRIDSKDSQLIIGFDSVLLTTNLICLMKPSESVRSIPFSHIDRWEEHADGSGLTLHVRKRLLQTAKTAKQAKEHPQFSVKLVTGKASCIIHALQIIKNRTLTRVPVSQADVTGSVSPSFRVEMISFALYLMARHSATLQTQAAQLFEAAIRFGEPASNCEISRVPKVDFNLEHFFKEIAEMDIFDDIVLSLSGYCKDMPEVTIPRLLALFTYFMNRCENFAYLSAVAANVTSGGQVAKLAPILDRYFFGQLTSKKAIEAAIPVIMKADLDKVVSRSFLQAILRNNDTVVAKIVVNQFLDGALRRRSFGALLPPEQLFALLPSLAFACPALVNIDTARLLFCAVIGSCHVYEAVPDIQLFLQGVFATLLLTRQDIESKIMKYSRLISDMLQNPKVMDQFQLIMIMDKFTEILGEHEHTEYRRLLTQIELDDNPATFYLKAVAMIHLGQRSCDLGDKLIKCLTHLYDDENLGLQKVAFVFNALAEVIDVYPADSLNPIILMWAPIASLGSRNPRLRQAACKLLSETIKFTLKNGGFVDFNGLLTSQYISQRIVDCVDSLEKSLMVKFANNFSHAFIALLMRSLEEVETRECAIELLKVCITAHEYDPMITTVFVLPMVAFGTAADLAWVLSNVQVDCKTIPELVFKDFSSQTPRDSAWIISFLCGMFGERHCSQSAEVIADTLIYGIKQSPAFFEGMRTIIVEKCWKMIDSEASIERIEKVAALSAAFLGIADSGVGYTGDVKLMKVIHIGDDSMKKTLKMALDGVDKGIQCIS